MKFRVVIPARMDSQRLPRKPLADVAGRPLIVRTADRAIDSGASEVVVATDHKKIAELCQRHDLTVQMTDPAHSSGTDRVAEVARAGGWAPDDIVVNVQGDEPCIPPENIRQVAELINGGSAEIATLATPIDTDDELHDPNVVKVVVDANGLALYFSRAPIPWARDGNASVDVQPLRHLGIYAFRVRALERFANSPITALERHERLEQLRALWNGWPIAVAVALQKPGPGVDTSADLEAARAYFGASGE